MRRSAALLSLACALLGAGALSACAVGAPEPMDPWKADRLRYQFPSLWYQLAPALGPTMDDEARAIAIARWVAASSTNTDALARSKVSDTYVHRPFLGSCGLRSMVFVELAQRAGLWAEPFNLYNFPYHDGGHSAAQVFYGGQWHFFDVTYAGYFHDGLHVLSFDEVHAWSPASLSMMSVFAENYDRWLGGAPVDNAVRMREVYGHLDADEPVATSFLGSGKPVPMVLYFDRRHEGLRIPAYGGPDSDALEDEARWRGVSQYASVAFGRLVDNFQPVLAFADLVPGDAYAFHYDAQRVSGSRVEFQIGIEGGALFDGRSTRVVTSEAAKLRVAFRAERATVQIRVRHALSPGEGLLGGAMTFARAERLEDGP